MEKPRTIEPRVTALEVGQEALHREMVTLTSVVKDQGMQLTSALGKLIDSHNSSYSDLSDKISKVGKTDPLVFWSALATLIILIGAISTPIWMNFSSVDKTIAKIEAKQEKLEDFAIASIKENTESRIRLEIMNEKRDSSSIK